MREWYVKEPSSASASAKVACGKECVEDMAGVCELDALEWIACDLVKPMPPEWPREVPVPSLYSLWFSSSSPPTPLPAPTLAASPAGTAPGANLASPGASSEQNEAIATRPPSGSLGPVGCADAEQVSGTHRLRAFLYCFENAYEWELANLINIRKIPPHLMISCLVLRCRPLPSSSS